MNSGNTHFAAKPQTFKLPILRRGFPLFIVCILRSLSGRTARGAPPGGFGELGEWLFIFRELESTGNYFRGAREQAHHFGDLGSLAKKQKKK